MHWHLYELIDTCVKIVLLLLLCNMVGFVVFMRRVTPRLWTTALFVVMTVLWLVATGLGFLLMQGPVLAGAFMQPWTSAILSALALYATGIVAGFWRVIELRYSQG